MPNQSSIQEFCKYFEKSDSLTQKNHVFCWNIKTLKKSENKERAIVLKLVLSRPESFLNLQGELKEETSVDTEREKPNFRRNIGEKWVSTILTNSFDKKVGPFFYGYGLADSVIQTVRDHTYRRQGLQTLD